MKLAKTLFKLKYGGIWANAAGKVAKLIEERKNTKLKKFRNFIATHKYAEAADYGASYLGSAKCAFREIASCYYLSGNVELANKYMEKYLNSEKIEVNDLFRALTEHLHLEESTEFTYSSAGGFANLGFITFCYENEEYFVKIMESTWMSKRECYFYENIAPQLGIQENIPEFKCVVYAFNKIMLVTKKVTGHKPTQEFDARYYKVILRLQSYPITQFPMKRKFQYNGNREASLLHKRTANLYIIESMKDNAALAHADEIFPIIAFFQQIIVTDKLYNRVKPAVHYSFCHNDFHRNNLLCDEQHAYVLDWANYIGTIKGWDLAYYVGNFEVPFITLKEKIESDFFDGNSDDSVIGKIFLTYMIVYIWTQRLHGKYDPVLYTRYFQPAKEYVVELEKRI